MNPMDIVNQTLDELNKNYACKCGPIQAIEVPGDMSAAIYDRKTKLGIIVIGKDAVCDDPVLMRFMTSLQGDPPFQRWDELEQY